MTEAINKRIGLGHQLGVCLSSTGTDFVDIGVLVNVQGGGATKKSINASLYNDITDTFLCGEIDAGSFEFEIALDPQNTSNTLLATIFNQSASDQIPNWCITSPAVVGSTSAPPTRTFNAFIDKMDEAYEKSGLVIRKIGLKVSGSPNFATST